MSDLKRKYLGVGLLGFKVLTVLFQLWEAATYIFGFFTSLGVYPQINDYEGGCCSNQTLVKV